MKKILFVAQNFEVGGVQTSLLNLLKKLSKEKDYDIDLFIFGKGELISQIPENISVTFGNRRLSLAATPFGVVKKKKNILNILLRIFLMINVRIVGSERFYRNLLKKHVSGKNYDAAISYFNDVPGNYFNQGTNMYVSDFVSALEKVAWIHNDVDKGNFDKNYCFNIYKNFDRIICVSKGVKETFDALVPEYSNKTEVIYNMFCEDEIKDKAQQFKPFEEAQYNIVTVARIDNVQKRIDGIVRLCKRLKDDGVTNFMWRIVGGGPDLEENIKLAKDLSVTDVLEFCGEQINPYPFIKHSELFALYSAYEGHPMVIGETKVLNTYIITTAYAAAKEQVAENDGVIAIDDEDFYSRIKELIKSGSKNG